MRRVGDTSEGESGTRDDEGRRPERLGRVETTGLGLSKEEDLRKGLGVGQVEAGGDGVSVCV